MYSSGFVISRKQSNNHFETNLSDNVKVDNPSCQVTNLEVWYCIIVTSTKYFGISAKNVYSDDIKQSSIL